MLVRLRKMFGQRRYLKRPSQIINYFTCKVKSMELAVTYACNQNCPGCYAGDLKDPAFLTQEQVKDIVKKYKPFHINITGGEPLLRKDICEIIEAIPKGVVVSMVTNGVLLTEEKLRNLKKAGLNTLQLSYGKNYINKLDIVRSAAKGINVCLSVTNTKPNREYIEQAMIEARKSNWHVLWNVPSGSLVKLFDRETYFKYRNDPIVREDNMFWAGWNTCPAGKHKIYVTAKGELMPCDRLHKVYPDLKTMRKDFKNKVYCNRIEDLKA
ncbi:MAG: radical SAM protein [Candidatus Nanoarchaeia archaeon]|nr:radical SAM protein [Candidatus Nanoarchaeia archaeon]MDD5587591.1 radical SAM protein [Candidatus Nanoarchaeia archaeon]